LEHIPLYQAWRQLTQWSSDRALQGEPELFSVAVAWMAWVDQALSLLEAMSPTRAYRTVKRWRYPDLFERFPVGRDDVVWYEPKSVAWNSPGHTEGQDLARDWASECAGECTIFIIENFHGFDISWLSAFPDEHEAMTRALTKFEVLNVQQGDSSSDDPFLKADRVTLKQLPLQRLDPIPCKELNYEKLRQYENHVMEMKAVECFSETFNITWRDEQGLTKQDLKDMVVHDRTGKMDDFPIPAGTKGMFVAKSSNTKADEAHFKYKLMAYNQDVNGNYDVMCCWSEQNANFDSVKFGRMLEAKKLEVASLVRQRGAEESGAVLSATLGWVGMFDWWHDVQKKTNGEAYQSMSERRTREEKVAFEDVLAGYMLKMATESRRLAYDDEASGRFRLFP